MLHALKQFCYKASPLTVNSENCDSLAIVFSEDLQELGPHLWTIKT